MTNKTQLTAVIANILIGHTVRLCDSIGHDIAEYTDASKLADAVITAKGDSFISVQRKNSEMFLGGFGITNNHDDTVTLRYFSRAIEHLDPNHANYAA